MELYNTHCLMITYRLDIVSLSSASQDIESLFIMKSDLDYATKITRNDENYANYINPQNILLYITDFINVIKGGFTYMQIKQLLLWQIPIDGKISEFKNFSVI